MAIAAPAGQCNTMTDPSLQDSDIPSRATQYDSQRISTSSPSSEFSPSSASVVPGRGVALWAGSLLLSTRSQIVLASKHINTASASHRQRVDKRHGSIVVFDT